MIKIPICMYVLFLATYNLHAMNRAEELRHMHALLVRATNSPTLLDRVLREAGVSEDEMARVAHGILVNRQPIPMPFVSLNDLLAAIGGNHIRPITAIARVSRRRPQSSQPFLKSKIYKRSE